MSSYQKFWSDKAVQEFSALFDNASTSFRLKQLVADALNRGWAGNRDKPFWALCVVVAAMGENRSWLDGTNDNDDSLDIICLSPNDIWRNFEVGIEKRQHAGKVGMKFDGDGIVIQSEGMTLKLTRARLSILAKVAEFILVCEDFQFSQQVLSSLRQLSKSGTKSPDLIQEKARAFARMAYKYRKAHFLDGHGTSAFSVLKSFLSQTERFKISEESPFDFWIWDKNNKFKTYPKAYNAFVHFHKELKNVESARQMNSAMNIDDPAVQSILSTQAYQMSDEEEDDMRGLQIQYLDDVEPPDPASLLKTAPFQPFDKSQLRLLSQIYDSRKFGLEYPLAMLRLVSFFPVQSGISNSLRTGRSALPLERRILCDEAVPYDAIQDSLSGLETTLTEMLKISLSLRFGSEASDDQMERLRQEGVAILKNIKLKKSKNLENIDIQKEFRLFEPTLLRAIAKVRSMKSHVASRFKSRAEAMDEQFRADRNRFSAEFAKLYKGTVMDCSEANKT